MVLKLYDPKLRRRHQKRQQVRRAISILLLIGIVLFAVFKIGAESTKANKAALENDIKNLRADKQKLEQESVDLRANTMTAEARYQELERQYQNDIGNEDVRKMVVLLKERLNAGVKPERLATILSKAENIRQCTAPETKRFIAKTALSSGPANAISFANGSISVTGEGEPTTNDKGAKESWYDPGQAVSVTFKTTSGDVTKAEGILPLHHSIIQGNAEYRFTISKGARSFIELSADQCAYP